MKHTVRAAVMILGTLFSITGAATSVFADQVGVGESVTYNADSVAGSTTGSGSSHSGSNQDASVQANNSSVFNSMSKTYEDIMGNANGAVVNNGSQVVTYKETPVSTADLESFINQISGLQGKNLSTDYTDHNAAPVRTDANAQKIMNGLKKDYGIKSASISKKDYKHGTMGEKSGVGKNGGLPLDGGFSTHPRQGYMPNFKAPDGYYSWPADRKKWADEMKKWEEQWRDNFNKKREDLIASGLTDQTTLPQRQEVVKKYLDERVTAGEDSVDTAVVKEFKVTKEEKKAIKSKIGTRKWFWMIYADKNRSKCIYSTTTTVPYLSLAYDSVGTYYIDVYQDIAYTYADNMSYDVNEYWYLQDTQQVLWQKHIRKDKYLNERDPVIKQEKVNSFSQKVTEDMVNNWIAGRGGATQSFDTERIK